MKFKKLLSLAAAAAVTVSALPSVFADSYSDISGHWAEAAINRLSDNGIIHGSDGKVRPEDYISRAELATVLYNTMGGDGAAEQSTEYSQTGSGDQWISSALSDGDANAASFSDFAADKWYASAMKWAVGAEIITGYEDNTLKPENPVTRQEAVVIIQRACGIDGGGDITAGDAAEVGDWAKDAVGSFMQNGFLNGDEGGRVNPTANIKRCELFTLLNNIIGEFINTSGEYDYINCGNKLVIVKSGSVVIKNAKCGRIIIGADADEPEIDNVVVKVKVFGNKKIKVSSSSGSGNWGGGSSGGSSSGSSGGSSGGGSGSSFSSNKVRLTLNANGGVFSDGSERQIISCLKGMSVDRKIEEEPTREGYIFKGWYTTADRADRAGDNYYKTSNTLNNALTLYAGWVTSENLYTVTAAPMTDPSKPDEEQVKDYKVDTNYDKGTISISGSELKKFKYDSNVGEKTWAGIKIEMSNVVIGALENSETLHYYAGEKRRSGGWTGNIEDIKSGTDTLLFYFDVSEEPQIKYIEFELPEDMKDHSIEFELDLTKLTLYEYPAEPVESTGVSIAKSDTDENVLMGADFKLEMDLNAGTYVASGTLNYVINYPETGQSGNYMLLDITLGSAATDAATVKLGDEVVPINEKNGTLLIKVDETKTDVVITVDYDGDGEAFKATDYTVVTGTITLAPEAGTGENPSGGGSSSSGGSSSGGGSSSSGGTSNGSGGGGTSSDTDIV